MPEVYGGPEEISTPEEIEQQNFLQEVFNKDAIPLQAKRRLDILINEDDYLALSLQEQVIRCIENLGKYGAYENFPLKNFEIPDADKFGAAIIAGLLQRNLNPPGQINKKQIKDFFKQSILGYLISNFDSLFFIISQYLPDNLEERPFNPELAHKIAKHKLMSELESANIAYLFFYLKCAQVDGLKYKTEENSKLISFMVSRIKHVPEERLPEWRKFLDYLATKPDNSLESNFRNLVIEQLQNQYSGNKILADLAVPDINFGRKLYRSLFWVFSNQTSNEQKLAKNFNVSPKHAMIPSPYGTMPHITI